MNKLEFLSELATRLNTLPRSEIDKSIAYYSEIIDDRMEDGMSEVNAVCGLGNIEEIARETMLDATPLPKLLIPSHPISKLDIILCSPLIITVSMLILAFYTGVWLVIIALFLLDLSFALVGIAGIVASIVDSSDHISFRLLMFFGGLISISIGIFAFPQIKRVSRKISGLTIWFLRNIKSRLLKRKRF